MFRPLNSSESNLFTIRASIGYGSQQGVFKFSNASTNGTYIIAGGADTLITSGFNYLSSPSTSNLPYIFSITLSNYISGIASNNLTSLNNNFIITYGTKFTSQPSISIVPNFVKTSITPVINGITVNLTRTSLSGVNLTFISGYDNNQSSNTSGLPIPPSVDGLTGLLGFDIVITGPVAVGIKAGNSNIGWGTNDTTTGDPMGNYALLDTTLGSGNIVSDSIVIAKNLKLLNRDGNIKTYTDYIVNFPDHTQTVWILNGPTGSTIYNVQPQLGMYLVIIGISPMSYINMAQGCYYLTNKGSYDTSTYLSMHSGGSITLFGISSKIFIVLNSIGVEYPFTAPSILNLPSSNYLTTDTIDYVITTVYQTTSYDATWNGSSTLPGTLSINNLTGRITGRISNASSYTILLSATNTYGTGTKSVIFIVSNITGGVVLD
jgi:hypothetical protein